MAYLCRFGDFRSTPLTDDEAAELDELIAEADRTITALRIMRSTRWQG